MAENSLWFYIPLAGQIAFILSEKKNSLSKKLFFQNSFLVFGLILNLVVFFVLGQFFPRDLSWMILVSYLMIFLLFLWAWFWGLFRFSKDRDAVLPFLKSFFENLE